MPSRQLEHLLKLYEDHPLSEGALMKRIGPTNTPVTEFDLAVDHVGELTDQNHIGGFQSTIALAEAAQISAQDRVIDLGCGLGGPARVLAAVYKCRVHGVDASPVRIKEARSLTRLVGLETRVSFSVDDIQTLRCDNRFSVLWAQNSWIHFAEPALFGILAPALLVGNARIAFEDVCLMRDCTSSTEEDALTRLCAVWGCRLFSPTAWALGLANTGFPSRPFEDAHTQMISYLTRILHLADAPDHRVPDHEVAGWRLALELTRRGLISYVRFVGWAK